VLRPDCSHAGWRRALIGCPVGPIGGVAGVVQVMDKSVYHPMLYVAYIYIYRNDNRPRLA
jgi:hypothetical protein